MFSFNFSSMLEKKVPNIHDNIYLQPNLSGPGSTTLQPQLALSRSGLARWALAATT